MSAGDEAFEFLRDAFGGDPRVVQDGDAVGELVGFFQVLGGEEDGDAAGDHMVWRLRGGGGGGPVVGSSRKMMRGSPTRVMAMSRRRFLPPE
ncbi:hypothetical protein A7J05_36500 [Streptomyces alfalfae]|uniref:Uncharacterized protein n=1 Tax=Streptomyces alfalfae TaxID=1642299 RepID=A0ABN4VV09_9ACTN|nr:hypothetical protein A7J05_36500 [Streptomyces alfalfae]